MYTSHSRAAVTLADASLDGLLLALIPRSVEDGLCSRSAVASPESLPSSKPTARLASTKPSISSVPVLNSPFTPMAPTGSRYVARAASRVTLMAVSA